MNQFSFYKAVKTKQMEQHQEVFTSSMIFNALYQCDQTLAQELDLIKDLSSCLDEQEKLRQYVQVQNRLQKELDSQSIRSLHCQVYNEYQTFFSFSQWCLNFNFRSRKMSLLRCVMLLSLSMKYLNQKSAGSINQNSNPQKSKDKNQQISISSANSEDLLDIGKQNEKRSSFLEEIQNEQILVALIDKDDLYGHQMFIWRQLLYEINPQNGENTLQVAKIHYDLKDYEKTLRVLRSMPRDSPFKAEADLLRGLAYKQLKQAKNAQFFMKQALRNEKNRHPQPQKCYIQIAQLCYSQNRYTEAAHFYDIYIKNNKCDIQLRYKRIFATFYARIYQQVKKQIHEILYLDNKGIRLTLLQKSMLMIVRARVYGQLQKGNEFRQIIQHHYNQALNLLRQPDGQANSLKNQQNQRVKFYRTKYIYRKRQYIEAKYQFQNCLKYDAFSFQVFIYLAMCNIVMQPVNMVDFAFYLENIQKNLKNIQQLQNPDLIIDLNQLFQTIKEKKIIKQIALKKQEDYDCQQDKLFIKERRFYRSVNQMIQRIHEWTERKAMTIIEQLLISYQHFYKMEMYEVALDVLDRAKQLSSQLQIVYTFSGRCFIKLEDFNRAEKQFKKALKRDEKSIGALMGLFIVFERKESQQQIIEIGKRILRRFRQLRQKKNEDLKQECFYKHKLGKLLAKQETYQQAYPYLCESLEFYNADPQYYTVGLKLYLSSQKTVEARNIFQELQKYKKREDICLRDLVTSFVLMGDTIKLKKYLKNQEFETDEEKELRLTVQTILELPTCSQQQLKERSNLVMDYITRLQSGVQQQMNVYRVSAIAYRTAEVLHSKQAYKEANSFYSEIAVRLHPDISQKVQYCAQLASNSQYATSLKGKLQIYQRDFLLPSSKPQQKQFHFGFKKFDERLVQLLEIYQVTGEEQKLNALVQQIVKQIKIKPSEKASFLQRMFDLLHKRRGQEAAEEFARNKKTPLVLFLFYLYFEKEDGLLQTLGIAFKQMMAHPNNKVMVVAFKVSIAKRAKGISKTIVEIIDQFNKAQSKKAFIESIDTFEKANQYLQLRKQETEENS